jgi:3-oxoacyl-[acyl-carrier protein] reductase
MRVAVVTGGNRGIGAAIVRRLAADGLAVVIGYCSDATAAEAVRDQVERDGGRAITANADLSHEDHISALMEEVRVKLGAIDILVNNAAIREAKSLVEIDSQHIDAQFAVNVKGLLLASKYAAEEMAQGGSIINISSVNARHPIREAAVYCATKAAVEAITKALARELGPRGIRVNAVAPGVTLTEKHTITPDDTLRLFISETPLGRLGTPEEVAAAVAFLGSKDASWITGEIIAVTGGYQV